MTIFKSQQVNLDPAPYTCPSFPSVRHTHGEKRCGGSVYAPRPEFEPTRDEYPWLNPTTNYRHRSAWLAGENVAVWAPRREQFDTPVNRVLVLFRRDAEHNGIDSALEYDWPTNSVASTPDEINHARRVLTRLAGWSV